MNSWTPFFFLPLAAVLACRGGEGDAVVTTDTTDTSMATMVSTYLPLWVYASEANHGAVTFSSLSGEEWGSFSDGVTFFGSFFGPTLVAEPDQRIFFQVTNRTEQTASVETDEQLLVSAATVETGQTESAVMETLLQPGIYPWVDEQQKGRGFAGLVTVRDPDAFPVLEIDDTINLVLFEPDEGALVIDHCALASASTSAACPDMRTAPAGFTMAFFQRLSQVYTPTVARHGGPPNEFTTLTYTSRSVDLDEGEDVRMNLFNMSSREHTLAMGDLPFGPDGGPLGDVTLGPGEGLQLTAPSISPPAEHLVRCVDCDWSEALDMRIRIQ